MLRFLLARLLRDEQKLSDYSLPKAALLDELADRTVAIVGNARALSATSVGSEIDRSDIVIRINAAPIPAAKSHGSRTDWLAMSTPVSPAILAERNPSRLLWMTRKRKRISYSLANDPRFYLNSRPDWQDLRLKLGAPPTTGLMIIDFVAQSRAKSIRLYGFDFFVSKSLSGRRDAGQVPHDFALEKAYVANLIATDQRFQLVPAPS